MPLLNLIWEKFSPEERKTFLTVLNIILLLLITFVFFSIKENGVWINTSGGVYKEGILGQPININPVISNNSVDQKISKLLFSPLSLFIKNLTISPDGKEYGIEIKDNLKWSDGSPITSDDIIFTIKTIQNPNANSLLYETWDGVKIERVSLIKVNLKIPNSNFLFKNQIENLQIIPAHIFENIPPENFLLSEYRLKPISSGPYKFYKLSKQKNGFIASLSLIPNENFPLQKPLIKKFEFVFFKNEKEIIDALTLHKISGFGTWALLNNNIEENINKFYKIEKILSTTYYALFFNENSPLFKNQSFKKALMVSINLEELRKNLGENFSENEEIALIKKQKVNYDLSLAQTLLSQLKSKNKSSFLSLNFAYPNLPYLEKIADFIKKSWEKAGVDEVNTIKFDIFYDSSIIKNKNYDVILFGNTLANLEDLYPFWHSSQINYPGTNLSAYKNPQVDNLLEKIRQTNDEEERKKILNDVSKIINEDGPAFFLFNLPYYYIYPQKADLKLPKTIVKPEDIYEKVSEWSLIKVKVIKKGY